MEGACRQSSFSAANGAADAWQVCRLEQPDGAGVRMCPGGTDVRSACGGKGAGSERQHRKATVHGCYTEFAPLGSPARHRILSFPYSNYPDTFTPVCRFRVVNVLMGVGRKGRCAPPRRESCGGGFQPSRGGLPEARPAARPLFLWSPVRVVAVLLRWCCGVVRSVAIVG